MDDQELREQLARGPLARKGFDEQLRRRINEEIDRPRRRTRLVWAPLMRLGGALAVVFAVLAGAWIWQGQSDEMELGDQLQSEKIEDASPSASSSIAYTKELPRSVMLIGLRDDDPDSEASTYRSLLVTPEEGELAVNVSLEGLYMPYKQKFYRLDNVDDLLGSGSQIVTSTLAGQPRLAAIEADPAYRTNEKVLFAGNKYVSLLQTKTNVNTGVTIAHYWVKDVEQLTIAARQTWAAAEEEPHYSVKELVPQSSLFSEQWTITRQEGHWVGKAPKAGASISHSSEALAEIAVSQNVPAELPVEVSSYDTLWLNWDEIRAREPSAIDAFTSPTQDLLAVQTDGAVRIYAYRMQESDMKPLTIPLEEDESVVMVQWAQDGYVDVWKQTLSQWIATAQGD